MPDSEAADADLYAIDAAFYDAIHGEGGEDLDFWLPFAAEHGGPILEVGAGTGRIALLLARAGHAVTALDPSPAMLTHARQRADAEGLALTFLEGGLPGAPFPAAAFPTIILPNDIFLACGAGEGGQAAALRACAAALAPGGRLAIDVAGPGHWLEPVDAEADADEPILAFSGELGGERLTVWHIRRDDLAAQTRHLRVRYELTAANGVVRRLQSEHLLRYVTCDDLERLLRDAGLRAVDRWGDYGLGALTNASERLIVIAEHADFAEGSDRATPE